MIEKVACVLLHTRSASSDGLWLPRLLLRRPLAGRRGDLRRPGPGSPGTEPLLPIAGLWTSRLVVLVG